MGLMDSIRGQFIDIVEFLDDSRDTIVWRFPRHDNEIKNGAQLIVRESQTAVVVDEGQIADVFPPGRHVMDTKNLPILSDLKGWKYGFESPFKVEVYFVTTRLFTDMKWGTQAPITMTDAKFGMVSLRAFGGYAMQVVDAAKLVRQLVGTDPNFSTDEVAEFLRTTIVSQVGTSLATSGIPMIEMAANQQKLGESLAASMTTNLADMGVAIPKFYFESINLPPEVQTALDARTKMGILGDLDQFAKLQAAEAIGDAAINPGGAGAGMGLGMGMALGQAAQGALAAQPAAPAAPAGPPPIPAAAQPLFIAVNGAQVGPVAIADLPARVTAGELTPTTLVWRDGMSGWVAASELAELRGLFPATPPPLPPQS